MGCVSSHLLNNEDDFTQLGSSAFSHHIVSLTSTTYGLLNLDPPPSSATTPQTPPPRFTFGSIFPTPLCDTKPLRSDFPETINSWELMSGLDTESFRLVKLDKENSNPNSNFTFKPIKDPNFTKVNSNFPLKPIKESNKSKSLAQFEKLCPPNGENRVVIYTTTLRGIRETFDACNSVRAAIGGFGVSICERDVSMDSGFREELRDLMKGKEETKMVLPRVFVKGRYIGGAEEVLKLVEEGLMGEILNGLPKKMAGDVCDGCGDARFLPCFACNGSSKLVMVIKEDELRQMKGRTVVVKCPDCNENGLVLCPICA